MTNIKNFAIGALIGGSMALVAATVANARQIVNPTEAMVVVPGLEQLGPSRISSVQFCVKQTGVANWRQLVTDSELESMDLCLQDLT